MQFLLSGISGGLASEVGLPDLAHRDLASGIHVRNALKADKSEQT